MGPPLETKISEPFFQEESHESTRPAATAPETRYRTVVLALERPNPLESNSPWYDAGVRGLANFRRTQAGDTVELLALQARCDPQVLYLLNDVQQGHALETGRLICLSRTHRCAPDESLEFLAGLYQTNVATLRTLNHLAKGELPPAWKKITVPPQLIAQFLRDGTPMPLLLVYAPNYSDDLVSQWIDAKSSEQYGHRVAEGDTWESIAATYGTTAPRLIAAKLGRDLPRNGSPATPGTSAATTTPPLGLGDAIVVGSSVVLREHCPPLDLALFLDFLLGDLDELLELNQLEKPEQLASQHRLLLPPSAASVQFTGSKGPLDLIFQIPQRDHRPTPEALLPAPITSMTQSGATWRCRSRAS